VTRVVISEEVRQFLAEDVASLERLDVLLLMRRHVERWWAAHTLSGELGLPVDVAQMHLEKLCGRNLLEVRIAESVIYRYQPATSWLADLVDEVSRVHYADRHSIVALVAGPPEGVRLFAEAFRFRKGKPHG
jgi:hypothetical protein